MKVTVVIPSRKRPETVPTIEGIFPAPLWCVSKSDAKSYDVPQDRLLIHPDDVVGIARKRQWILDRIKGPVFQADDDIGGLWCNVGKTGRDVEGHENIMRVIQNAADAAAMLDAPVFGFDQAWDVRKFDPMDPVRLTGWAGTAIGFIGRELRYDESLLSQADIDFCLRCLLKKRIIYLDRRFAFKCKRFTNAGGSAGVRSMADYQEQIEKVLRRWGRWVAHRKVKQTHRLLVRVPRRQPLEPA